MHIFWVQCHWLGYISLTHSLYVTLFSIINVNEWLVCIIKDYPKTQNAWNGPNWECTLFSWLGTGWHSICESVQQLQFVVGILNIPFGNTLFLERDIQSGTGTLQVLRKSLRNHFKALLKTHLFECSYYYYNTYILWTDRKWDVRVEL